MFNSFPSDAKKYSGETQYSFNNIYDFFPCSSNSPFRDAMKYYGIHCQKN